MAIFKSDTGTGNKTIDCRGYKTATYIAIVNRSGADLTFTVNGIATKVTPDERSFDGYFNPFNEIVVEATGEWEIKVGD